jgi:RNA polymerase sigma-70 factor (ECF subfamily)
VPVAQPVTTPDATPLDDRLPVQEENATLDLDEQQLAQEEAAARDGEAVRDILAGNVEAYNDLMSRYGRRAISASYRLLGNQEDASDVVQDAFLKAYRSLDTLERPEAFGGWLLRIVTNLSLNHRRGRRLRLAQSIDNGFGEQRGDKPAEQPMPGHGSESFRHPPCPERAARGRELGVHLREALKSLPEKQRQALLLFTVEQLPQREVAQRLDCSIEAVKWHVFQGRKKLRDLLGDVI